MYVRTAQHFIERRGQALLLRWQTLTEPATEIEEPQQRRQASLLAALTLGLLVLSLLTVTSFLITDASQHIPLPLPFVSVDLIAVALLVIAYKASRTRRFWIGGALIMAMTYGATLSLALVTPQDADKVAPYFILSLLLCSMLFPLRRTLIYAAIIVLTLPLLPKLNAEVTAKNITYALTSVLTATGLIVVWVYQRNLIEADRRAARKKVEDALAYERDLLSTLMNSIPDAIYYKDTAGHYLRINTAQTGYLGVDEPADVLGKTAADFFSPDQSQQSKEEEAIIVATGKPMPERPENITLPDGQQVWLSLTKAPIFNLEGQVRGIVAVTRNVTESKQARAREMRLMELEQLQRTVAALFLQSGDPDIVITYTLRLIGEFFEVSSTDVFQMQEQEAVAENTHGWAAPGVGFKFLRDADLMRVAPSFLPVLARDGLLVADDVSELPTDTFEFLNEAGIQSLLAMPFHVDGRLHGFITVAEKRRRRNWMPEEIATVRSIAESFSRVLERQHSQTALILARDAALHSVKLKSQFMSNMSHEVRTPMTGVLGMLELLCETELNDDQREFATTAFSSAKNLLHLLDDILDFAKIEAGRILLESKAMDVRNLIKDVETTFAAQAGKKKLNFVTAIAADVPRVSGDPTRLRQVLMNLTSNAIKFTKEGSVGVSVWQVTSAPGHSRLRFEVSDTGIGIETSQQQSIFDSFVQADGTITRKFGGTGLGLAICKQLVELMGGELGVESAIGKGSTFGFTITLPIAQAKSDTSEMDGIGSGRIPLVDENLEPARTPEDFLGTDAAFARILVAEDNLVNQRIVREALRSAQLKIDIAEDGEQVLALIQQHDYRLILMDIHMPTLDGLTTTRRIRAMDGPISKIPIIAMTASVLAEEEQRYREAGMNGMLGKPLTVAQLRSQVKQWLTESRLADQA